MSYKESKIYWHLTEVHAVYHICLIFSSDLNQIKNRKYSTFRTSSFLPGRHSTSVLALLQCWLCCFLPTKSSLKTQSWSKCSPYRKCPIAVPLWGRKTDAVTIKGGRRGCPQCQQQQQHCTCLHDVLLNMLVRKLVQSVSISEMTEAVPLAWTQQEIPDLSCDKLWFLDAWLRFLSATCLIQIKPRQL